MNYSELTTKLTALYTSVEKDKTSISKAMVLVKTAATINSIQRGKLHANIKTGKGERPTFYND